MSTGKELFMAVERNNLQKVKYFIEVMNIPVTVTNGMQQTLAHIAGRCNNLNVLKYILKKDPRLIDSLDYYSNTILHASVVKGAFDVVKYLVEEYDAKITFLGGRDKDRTALHVAAEFNYLNILKYFVDERKIDFNVPNISQTQPPIFLAVKRKSWDVIEYLIEEKNADLTIMNANKENILFLVVRQGLFTFLKYLLDEKKVNLDVNSRNNWGETIVHIAAVLNRVDILIYLVNEKHAEVNVQKVSDKKTPLHYAAARNRFTICEFLIEHGANPKLRDTSGYIPAQQATDYRLIEYLETGTRSRRRRNVDTSQYSSLKPTPLPFEYIQPGIIADIPRLMEKQGVAKTSGNTFTEYQFQSFLLLAKSMVRSRKNEHELKHRVYFPSPSSILQNRMSPVAMDVVDETSNYFKF